MTYVVNWSSQAPYNADTGEFAAANIGKSTINITNNTTNGSTSIVLTGQGWSGYGQMQQENYIRLMENFASESPPANPTVGQMWYQTSTQTPMVYNIVTPATNTITGSTAGGFISGENVTQAVTGATAVLVGTVPLVGPMTLIGNSIVGVPDATHLWTGQTSLSTFTPTAAPVFHAATFAWASVVSATSIATALGYVPYNPGTNIAGYLTAATGVASIVAGSNITVSAPHGNVMVSTSLTPTFTSATISTPPTLGTDATNKLYVDTNSQGLNVHAASNFMDDGTGPSQIPAALYSGGTLDANGGHGIGATLSGAGSLTVDGNVVAINQRVLINISQPGGSVKNGIYTLTTASPWVLTRSTDMNNSVANQFVPGDFTFVTGGTKYSNSGWSESGLGSGAPNVPVGFPNNANHSFIIGTDATAVFTQFSGQGSYTAGPGLSLVGSQFNNIGVITLTAGTGINIGGTSTAPIVTATGSVTGTSNQVLVNGTTGSAQTGAVTLTLPQSIATSSSPTFGGLNFSGGTGATISPSPTSYGTIALDGASGPWAGIQFTSTTSNLTLMFQTGAAPASAVTGVYSQGTSAWLWEWQGGTLVTGTVPAARLGGGTAGISITGSSGSCTGNSATATTASNCTGNSATATIAANGGVTSVNSRTGAVTISSADVTGALGYTPANSSVTPSFTSSVNGQANFTSGFQMRWGVVAHTVGTSQTHSFSAPFSNACFVVIPTVRNNVGSGISAGVEFFNIVDGSITQFGWTQYSNNTCQIEYIAYGH